MTVALRGHPTCSAFILAKAEPKPHEFCETNVRLSFSFGNWALVILDSMPHDQEQRLNDIRTQIDSIDRQLVRLLNERATLAQAIGNLKGLDGKPFFTPERERQIFRQLDEDNDGPLRSDQLAAIFREIISAARAAEKNLDVAYWGPPGTFTHLAAIQAFGTSTKFLPQESISEVFLAVEHGTADYGVAPVENSTAGIVPETLDMFPQTNVKICAEIFLPIQHHLVSTAASLAEIEQVYAGTQPSAQCRRWLRENLPHAEVVEVAPTALAAEKALANPRAAAIASLFAAEEVGIPVLARRIEDHSHNRTRFLVIGYNEPRKTGGDKTSLMFNLRNRPGELHKALGAFVAHEVNLMMIESRPAQRSSFEYIFYCDCQGHQSDENVRKAIDSLKIGALEMTILGSYPAAE